MKALVVGEEEGLASHIGRALRMRWPDLQLTVAKSAGHGHRLLADDAPDVMFLPAALSEINALSLVGEIRTASDVVIIVVGSGDGDSNIVEALEAGADDYLATPISESLLVARVCAAVRRARRATGEEEPAVKCGDLAIDPETHEARLNGRPLYLTPTEFKLLYHLAQHQGRMVTQRALEQVVWGGSDKMYIDVLRKHVQRLRQKLQARRRGRLTITTVPRMGYKLENKKPVRSNR